MQVGAQDILPLLEESKHGICFLDTESTGTKGDYNSILVATVKPFGQSPKSFYVHRAGHDESLLRALSKELSRFLVWVTYYGKGFDIPMIQARLLHNELDPLPDRHHLDLYFSLKSRVLIARRSQAHYLEWLETPQQKMTLSPTLWNLKDLKNDLKVLVKRCESDCAGLEALYRKTRHLVRDIRK